MANDVPLPQTTIQDPEVVSIHEASHAVVALAKGLPLEFVTMTPDYTGKRLGGATYIHKSHEWNMPCSLYVYLAGKVGTEIYLNRACTVHEAGAGSDLHAYASATWQLALTRREIRDVQQDSEVTRRILRQHWPAVLSVAAALRDAPIVNIRERHAGDYAILWNYAGAESQRYLPGAEARQLYEDTGFHFWPSSPGKRPEPTQPWVIVVDDVLAADLAAAEKAVRS